MDLPCTFKLSCHQALEVLQLLYRYRRAPVAMVCGFIAFGSLLLEKSVLFCAQINMKRKASTRLVHFFIVYVTDCTILILNFSITKLLKICR